MNKLFFLILLTITSFGFSQSPKSFKYQAVVRNNQGVLLYNQVVSIKTSILADDFNGASVYTEYQTRSTNSYGVIYLNIGEGSLVSGNFSSISWGETNYFIKTEIDLTGQNSNYVFMGTSQIMSVPYALYSDVSRKSLNDLDTSATNEIQILSIAGNSISISDGNSILLPQELDGDPQNEIQTLQIVGDSLLISGANAVFLSGSVDLDSSPTNELQTLSIIGNQVSISNGNSISLPPDNDSDPTNEIQNLAINQGTLSISNSNAIHLPDSSATNEIQSLSISGNSISISNGNSINLPANLDNDPTNEIQLLNFSVDLVNGNELSITGGNSIFWPIDFDTSPTNEIQNLSITGNTLSISNGNSITLPPDGDSDSQNEIQMLQIDGDSLRISQGNAVKIISNERYVGEFWGGGIIFYLYKDSLGVQHGLIMTNQIYGPTSWSTQSVSPTNANSNYDGEANSILIASIPQLTNSAAKSSLNLEINDASGIYNDWYLPSVNELRLMLNFSNEFEYFIRGIDNSGTRFWSSTEYQSNPSSMALFVTYNYPYSSSSNQYKSENYYYRPIRKF